MKRIWKSHNWEATVPGILSGTQQIIVERVNEHKAEDSVRARAWTLGPDGLGSNPDSPTG